MLAMITALSLTVWTLTLTATLFVMGGEQSPRRRLLELMTWKWSEGVASRKTRKLCHELNAEQSKAVRREVTAAEAATWTGVIRFLLVGIPAGATSLSGAMYVEAWLGNFPASTAAQIGTFLLPLTITVLTLFGSLSISDRRPTICYTVNAAAMAWSSLTSPKQLTYEIPTRQAISWLEALARHLEVVGGRRIRPDGRRPSLALQKEMARAAAYVRNLRDSVLLDGREESRKEIAEKILTLLRTLLDERYDELAPASVEEPNWNLQPTKPWRQYILLAVVSVSVGLFVLLLGKIGLDSAIVTAVLALLAVPWFKQLRLPGHVPEETQHKDKPST
ncbi:hypothetical protein [Nonomuraea sp. NPDC049646]|uniref:hypothetical protein n=1 Tax=unclassified Nonomuraea TaxID=2593643 RepID=UPI003795E819